MADSHLLFDIINPVITLLGLGIIAVVVSKRAGLNPIVGYLLLGMSLSLFGPKFLGDGNTVETLSELGVVFLLFDIGLHFSFTRVQEQASNIFGFGALQVLLGTIVLGLIARLFGLSAGASLLIGMTLALSSTAVVASLIAERHQHNCPVGVTAYAILVFQDVAAIAVLIAVTATDTGNSVLPSISMALVKAAVAFFAGVVLARLVVEPLLTMIVRTQNEEVFTATALVIALAAGWATANAGLSMSLGAFLGGMILADTPYRAVIQSEIKPFRGLLLGFFFITVGLSLNIPALAHSWFVVIALAVLIIVAKIVSNMAASLVFRWSTPGSAQLGFLLAQGSEFAFVILSLPATQRLVGHDVASVLIGAVAVTLAATPTIAEAGRVLAGRMRSRSTQASNQELIPLEGTEKVLIVGMGPSGRIIADAMIGFDISYLAIEANDIRLRDAIADGYDVLYGDLNDPRLWETMVVSARKLNILTEPNLELSAEWIPALSRRYPELRLIVIVSDEVEAEKFAALNLRSVIYRPEQGHDLALNILLEIGVDPEDAANWIRKSYNFEKEVTAA
jgi:Kef-type K+ transport system membrane component KefB